MPEKNRYAHDWDDYSDYWDQECGAKYTCLGDEWNDDGTPDRKLEAFYFRAFIERWIGTEDVALEVGPGGGKWTVQIAPRVKKLTVLDVSERMLERTRDRCEKLGIRNVEYVKGNGADFRPVADNSVDYFFAYDVFVHIALEDTLPYAHEMTRVLVPGGRGACHHAVNNEASGWDRIELHNDWYRGGKHTIGQYYYYSPEALRRLYERCGLRVLEQYQRFMHCTCMFEKPETDTVARLEQALWRLQQPDAADDNVRASICDQLALLHETLNQTTAPLLADMKSEPEATKRSVLASRIRRAWRGV